MLVEAGGGKHGILQYLFSIEVIARQDDEAYETVSFLMSLQPPCLPVTCLIAHWPLDFFSHVLYRRPSLDYSTSSARTRTKAVHEGEMEEVVVEDEEGDSWKLPQTATSPSRGGRVIFHVRVDRSVFDPNSLVDLVPMARSHGP
jgi:hypothetical protein